MAAATLGPLALAVAVALAVGAGVSAAPAAPGDAPPARFQRRNRLAHRDVPCSEEDRRCFQQKKIRYPADGQCYRVGARGPCAAGAWLVARKELALREGRVEGVCAPRADADRSACLPLRVLMAPGHTCALRALVCAAAPGWRLAFDLFGEGECAAPGDADDAALPTVVADGSCKVVPSDLALRLYALAVPSRVDCPVRDLRGDCAPAVRHPEPQSFFDER
ncbi:hypothetical protein R5R35_004403 [Gryllus longicercus]|uniref:Uncharacterized protein n=1 Tax=Gryllus longicercus TaxID=2509291 RepID=A0AAN9VDL4_9ORTH